MATVVETDDDLGRLLNSVSKQERRAKQLASALLGVAAKEVQRPHLQGLFSRTQIVTLEDGQRAVIQFRKEEINMEPFQLAKRVLGQYVPDIKLLEDRELATHGISAYWMECMEGKTWLQGISGIAEPTVRGTALLIANKSLAQMFASGIVERTSEVCVEEVIRPHLTLIVESKKDVIQPFRAVAEELLGQLDQLKQLPLWISHFDMNETNIMVDDNHEISGIVDWELSRPLPFGAGFARIHALAGDHDVKQSFVPPSVEEAERGFWEELFDKLGRVEPEIHAMLVSNLEAVQLALKVGTLLDTFQMDEGTVGGWGEGSLKALPKSLMYRMPQIRGDDPPYST